MNKFQNILIELDSDLKKIDQTILEFATGRSPLIQEISHHLINSGGKRIRPILLVLASKICGVCDHNLAAAIELIHSATLLHDDVVDVSQVRRGKKTANSIWDNKVSILVGDYLFSVAFQLMVRSKNIAVLALLSKVSSVMADGEVMQIENSNNIALSEEKYAEIIFGKTAILFSAACEVGALINQSEIEKVIALREFGKNLGMAFQIIDDVLDYSSKEEVLGKDLGNDFFEGKVTLPVILTYEKSNPEERKFLSEAFEKNLFLKEKNQSDFAKVLKLIDKYDMVNLSKNRAKTYCLLASKNLETFPNSIHKESLQTILEYSLARIF